MFFDAFDPTTYNGAQIEDNRVSNGQVWTSIGDSYMDWVIIAYMPVYGQFNLYVYMPKLPFIHFYMDQPNRLKLLSFSFFYEFIFLNLTIFWYM